MWWRMERFDQELSIHDLTKRSTSGPSFRLLLDHLSIHDLTKRSTLERLAGNQSKGLSIHDLTKRSTLAFPCPWRCGRPFNSRPHEEVDGLPCYFRLRATISFNSRPHEEVDDIDIIAILKKKTFQFTTSRRGRRNLTREEVAKEFFQFTTSRRGRHCGRTDPYREEDLSIHDLTKRSTSTSEKSTDRVSSFNSRPHEEVDVSLGVKKYQSISFNSRPHEEVDVFRDCKCRRDRQLSIHDLTKRSTYTAGEYSRRIHLFQFTTSRRGRPN